MMMSIIFTFVFVVIADHAQILLGDSGFCNSYGPDAANPVYPVGSGTSGHDLQYTKAVSKLCDISILWIIHYFSKI